MSTASLREWQQVLPVVRHHDLDPIALLTAFVAPNTLRRRRSNSTTDHHATAAVRTHLPQGTRSTGTLPAQFRALLLEVLTLAPHSLGRIASDRDI